MVAKVMRTACQFPGRSELLTWISLLCMLAPVASMEGSCSSTGGNCVVGATVTVTPQQNGGTKVEPVPLATANVIKNDPKYYYFYHGTFARNLGAIGRDGMDPVHGGGKTGANKYEAFKSSDSVGVLKYALDPNIAQIYADAPAREVGKKGEPPETGVLLEARVLKTEFNKYFNEDASSSDKFWRRERGGENSPRKNPTVQGGQLGVNKPGAPGEKDHIWSVETNIKVAPADLRVILITLPKGWEAKVAKGEPGDLLASHFPTGELVPANFRTDFLKV